jgi:hypothetical protein
MHELLAGVAAIAVLTIGVCAAAGQPPPPDDGTKAECEKAVTQHLSDPRTHATGKQISDAIEQFCKKGR